MNQPFLRASAAVAAAAFLALSSEIGAPYGSRLLRERVLNE
jgi:hypothetical protein